MKNPLGRFHHDAQPAIYLSPNHAAANVAIDSYYRPDDPDRIIVPVQVANARILDFRNKQTSENFGLQGHETRVHWREELVTRTSASSWLASDTARETSADGLIYYSRKSPPHWHLVLFRWNQPDAPILSLDGPSAPFVPGIPL